MAQPIWITPSGNIGGVPSGIEIGSIQVEARPILPATSLTYSLLSGQLPTGLVISTSGEIHGTTLPTAENITFTFVIRATDNLANISDRTFTLLLSGVDSSKFITPSGNILTTQDSIWTEIQIEYSNSVNDEVLIRHVQGILPPGLEINDSGLIRGYPQPPYLTTTATQIINSAVATIDNTIECYSTLGFSSGRPVTFTGAVFGNITAGRTYYIKSVINSTSFTISASVNGPELTLSSAVGYMTVTLPSVPVNQPIIKTYTFTLKLDSVYGADFQAYSITVINQNTPTAMGGPGKLPNTRVPTLLNTRPLSYNILPDDVNYRYYAFPNGPFGETYPITTPAFIAKYESDNIFSFKALGYDFDNSELEYVFANLSPGLTGDAASGWLTGNLTIANNSISQFGFSVAVRKKQMPALSSDFIDFSFIISDNINDEIIWISPSDLGIIFNNTESILRLSTLSQVPLEFQLIDGSLPPNLSLLSSGEIAGTVSFQPTDVLLPELSSSEFQFTVQAYSPAFPLITASKTFTLTVLQKFANPMDTLYIKCTPSIHDRELLSSLLNDDTLIPYNYLYRPDDANFGKSFSVVYEHAYGINASNFDEYITAVTKNHYWRNITLGEIKTAIARNQYTGEVIYEVVYSSVYDNLVNYGAETTYDVTKQATIVTPAGKSVSKTVLWPRPIPLNPGTTSVVYPNSLINMRKQIVEERGQEQHTDILPLWMTSQQASGSTLGFQPAWVICYCLPRILVNDTALTCDEFDALGLDRSSYKSYAEQIQENIQTLWKTPSGQALALNLINFKIDRFSVDKSQTYNYDPVSETWSSLPSAPPFIGSNTVTVTVNESLLDRQELELISRNGDTIFKSFEDYEVVETQEADSKDFYVWFPQQTILPRD